MGALIASLALFVVATGIIYYFLIGISADGLSNYDAAAAQKEPPPTRFAIVNVIPEHDTQGAIPLPDMQVKIRVPLDTQAVAQSDITPDGQKVAEEHGVMKSETRVETQAEIVSSTRSTSLYVRVPTGRVRQEAAKDAAIKSFLYKGEQVNVIDEEGAWLQIHTEDGRSGWAHRMLFSEGPPSPAVNKEGLIKAIRTDSLTVEGGKILIELDDYCLPKTEVITGARPRVVCDFYGLRPASKLEKRIDVNSGIVRSIRLGRHFEDRAKTRVVIDLLPDKKYVVDQQFLIEDNIYLLKIHL